MRLIYTILVLGIVYGSLYPFNFNAPDSWNVLSDEFLATLFSKTTRGDLLGNIALFVPLGVIARIIMPSRARVVDFMLHGGLALFVAVAVQVLQLALPSRDPALQDAAWNMLGWVIGLGLARLITRIKPIEQKTIGQQDWLVPIGLMMCWLAYDLFPYIPTIDFQQYKDALKPLLLNPIFRIDSFLTRLAAWLVFASLMHYVWGAKTTSRLFPLISLGSLPLKIIIFSNSLNVHAVAAVLVANLIWAIIGKRERLPYGKLALLVITSIIIAGILPLDYDLRHAGSFYFVPFAGALKGSMLVNFLAVISKVYLFGGLFWLVVQGASSLGAAIVMTSLMVLMVEIIQMFSRHHTAEITDVLVVILVGSIIRTLQPSRRIQHRIHGQRRWSRNSAEQHARRRERPDPSAGR